jgi:hypothetical protein
VDSGSWAPVGGSSSDAISGGTVSFALVPGQRKQMLDHVSLGVIECEPRPEMLSGFLWAFRCPTSLTCSAIELRPIEL